MILKRESWVQNYVWEFILIFRYDGIIVDISTYTVISGE